VIPTPQQIYKRKGENFNNLLLLWYLQLTAHLVIPMPAANLQKKWAKFNNLLLLCIFS
jgi:hypothetical protein